ncbi:hypothetical protein EBZ80_21030 [bacterium]|nr:hypothetical protein [bacterium]
MNFAISCPADFPCRPVDCPATKPVTRLPAAPIAGLGLSFRDIGFELMALKAQILAQPVTAPFLASPYTQTQASVELLDRVWEDVATTACQTNVPEGYGKRVVMCTNGGHVFINVQTYDATIPQLAKSFYVAWIQPSVNFIYPPSPPPTAPLTTIEIQPPPLVYNPNEINIDNVVNNPNTPARTLLQPGTLLCTSPNPPPAGTAPAGYTATSFEMVENHMTRREIQQAMTSLEEDPVGWASRYSDTNFYVNYYVATTIVGADGYVVCLRLSYFRLAA